ncbi:MAG: hypothetical protein Kow0089_13250 [Desulfobulbaceae bacterium]
MKSIRAMSALACTAAVLLLSGCGSKDSGDTGLRYPPTDRVETVFQISQVPSECRVFAHLFATMPAGMSTGEFGKRVEEEARERGADVVLVGRSRQSVSETALAFRYYGPAREYKAVDWSGWSFGLEDWAEQGGWVSIGYDEWRRSDVHFDYPVVMQTVFFRCRQ